MENNNTINIFKTKISTNFYLNEFLNQDNEYYYDFSTLQIMTLTYLCNCILQPIREKFGITVINSGLRSEEHNKKIGGVANSDHLLGMAADICCEDQSMVDVFNWTRNQNFNYRQIIYYPETNMVHLSINTFLKERKQIAFIKKDNEESKNV